jgi:nucleotide-binding universal stress UspA family protein
MPVLAATDFSKGSQAAIRHASRVARARSDTLVLMHAVHMPQDESSWAYFVERAQRTKAEIEERVLDDLDDIFGEAVAEEDRPRHVEFVFEQGRPSDVIWDVTERKGADLVVIGGAQERAVASYFLGSTAEDVIRSAVQPTLVVPPDDTANRCQTVLAATDFSPASSASVEYAARWARLFDARLLVAHVVDEPGGLFGWADDTDAADVQRRARERLETWLEDVELPAGESPAVTPLVRTGRPHEALAELVDEEDVDIAVMGTHGQRGWKRYFVGSNTLKLLRLLPCPVVALRHREEAD